jgi:hypothetical protein
VELPSSGGVEALAPGMASVYPADLVGCQRREYCLLEPTLAVFSTLFAFLHAGGLFHLLSSVFSVLLLALTPLTD